MTGLLAADTSAADKRAAFRAGLTAGRIQRLPGAFNPLVAKLIQEIGFEGVYVSGAVVSADLALPDIGLTTLTEVAGRGRQIARVTDLPVLIDACADHEVRVASRGDRGPQPVHHLLGGHDGLTAEVSAAFTPVSVNR